MSPSLAGRFIITGTNGYVILLKVVPAVFPPALFSLQILVPCSYGKQRGDAPISVASRLRRGIDVICQGVKISGCLV